ncbi:MAG: phosphoadenylyl-sulfate reductase [Comamonas sp.]|nr:phosphoadenylyl-sulfate reductase [Comamonas sp.]
MASPLTTALADRWNALLQLLDGIAQEHPDALLASSMGVEDTLLIHALMQLSTRLGVFMLDTGRLHQETLAMVGTIEQRYGITVQLMHPEPEAVKHYIATHGLNAFYESVELRKLCCDIRKVEPLRRALAGHSAWITGQRREQSSTRAELPEAQWDEAFGLHKYNPLASWRTGEVWAVVRALNIPYHPLHDRGYPSIGCECCTRAIRPGEDIRAGRWWWEQRNNLECGLHTHVNTASHNAHTDPTSAT